MIKRLVVLLARQPMLRKVALSTPGIRDLAWRFVAGENLDAGIKVLRELKARGIRGSLNHVGTHVHDAAAADVATDDIVAAIQRIRAEGLDAHISIKPTQIGLDIDDATCRRNLRRALDVAVAEQVFIRIDMEESAYVERTIAIFEELRNAYGAANVGIVLQSYLRNPTGDLERLAAAGSRIRIVKGGYWEDPAVVYRAKADIDRAFARDVRLLLERATSPAIATHDAAVIAMARQVAAERHLDAGSFEFQMLYGVGRDLQAKLIRDGYAVRCYVPYGGDWFVYFLGCLRRLPAGSLRRIRRRLARSTA
ncbi:MAG: proline dehydrogenase family protein [Candidatus Limnocylindrales bacterium]